jgi:hypothetical protein
MNSSMLSEENSDIELL